jgi:hypothetical protein
MKFLKPPADSPIKERWLKRYRNERHGNFARGQDFQGRCKHKKTVYEEDGSQTCQRCGLGGLYTFWL